MKNIDKKWAASQDFNTATLPDNHEAVFLSKLKKAQVLCETTAIEKVDKEKPVRSLFTSWKTWSIAASIAILLGLGYFTSSNTVNDLSSVSPKMAQAQDYFTSTINQELVRLEKAQNPENAKIINATKRQLKILEDDYKLIIQDLKTNNDSQRVIAAMINNYQNRIAILETAMSQIEQLQQFKKQQDEYTL